MVVKTTNIYSEIADNFISVDRSLGEALRPRQQAGPAPTPFLDEVAKKKQDAEKKAKMGYEGFPTGVPAGPRIPAAPSGAQPGTPKQLFAKGMGLYQRNVIEPSMAILTSPFHSPTTNPFSNQVVENYRNWDNPRFLGSNIPVKGVGELAVDPINLIPFAAFPAGAAAVAGKVGMKVLAEDLTRLAAKTAAVEALPGRAIGAGVKAGREKVIPGAKRFLSEQAGTLPLGTRELTLKKFADPKLQKQLVELKGVAKGYGFDLTAVQGLKEGDYWVHLQLPREKGPLGVPIEFIQKFPDKLGTNEALDKIKYIAPRISDQRLGIGDGRSFLPFRNLDDAGRFLKEGDVSAVATEIKQTGPTGIVKPLTPEQRVNLARNTLKFGLPLKELEAKVTQLKLELDNAIMKFGDKPGDKYIQAKRDAVTKAEEELATVKNLMAAAKVPTPVESIPSAAPAVPEVAPVAEVPYGVAPEVTSAIAKAKGKVFEDIRSGSLPAFNRAAPDSMTQYAQRSSQYVIDILGNDPAIRLYRGVGPKWVEREGKGLGQFWTSDLDIAKQYARGRDIYQVDVKASEIANRFLGERVGGKESEYRLTEELSQRAVKLSSVTEVHYGGLKVPASRDVPIPKVAVTLPEAPPEVPPVEVKTPIQATQRVKAIQQKGKVAPDSVPLEAAKEAHIEMGAPDGPMPPKTPVAKGVPPSEEPSKIVRQIAAKATTGERPDITLLRLHEAAISNEQRRVNIITRDGNAKFRTLNVGELRRGQLVPRDTDIPVLDELYNALHNPSKVASGEVKVPKGFESIYQELRDLTNWEEAARLDFDPAMATVEDYFYRGWKPPEGSFADVSQGRPLVRTPSFNKLRVNATYKEMREVGFEPLYWNPYQQWGLSRMQGVKYREQMELVAHLKGMGDEFIQPHAGGPIPQGWRVPEVGPAFEGKPFAIADEATGEPVTMFTRRWIVPDKIANTLENIYGKRPDLGKLAIGGKDIDPLAVIDWLTFTPKRAKLIGSFFQQIDFLSRSGVGSWSMMVDSLMAGKPIQGAMALAKYPETVGKILRANFSPTYRQTLAKQLDSITPLLKDRPGVNLKAVSEAGLSLTDVTIFPKDMDKLVRQVATESGIKGKALNSVVELESAMRRGLFDGVYPAAIITDIENNIAPMVARMYPNLNDAQLCGTIARIANKKYSTIPASQSVIQNQVFRETAKRVFFSISESEGLLRQAAGAIRGPESAYWRKHWIGAYLALIATASVIHFASTGKVLPTERFTPITKDKWGPLPFGYNTRFASPTLPFTGRGGTELTLDVVGQMDTALRILNPQFFVESRTSVPVRSLMNQVSGTDFFGKPIDDVGPGGVVSRTTQLVQDMFSPIGIGGIGAEGIRRTVPGADRAIQEGEVRLGIPGLALQAVGTNIRAATREQRLRSVHGAGVQKTLDGLDNLGLNLGYVTYRFDTTFKVKGGEIYLTTAQREQLQWMTDDAIVKGIKSYLDSPLFQVKTNEEKKEYIKGKMTDIRADVRAKYRLVLKGTRQQSKPGVTPTTVPTTQYPKTETKEELQKRLNDSWRANH